MILLIGDAFSASLRGQYPRLRWTISRFCFIVKFTLLLDPLLGKLCEVRCCVLCIVVADSFSRHNMVPMLAEGLAFVVSGARSGPRLRSPPQPLCHSTIFVSLPACLVHASCRVASCLVGGRTLLCLLYSSGRCEHVVLLCVVALWSIAGQRLQLLYCC